MKGPARFQNTGDPHLRPAVCKNTSQSRCVDSQNTDWEGTLPHILCDLEILVAHKSPDPFPTWPTGTSDFPGSAPREWRHGRKPSSKVRSLDSPIAQLTREAAPEGGITGAPGSHGAAFLPSVLPHGGSRVQKEHGQLHSTELTGTRVPQGR